VKSWNSLACCSAVIPTPVSATASSTHSRPSATLRTRSATSPSFVNLQALLKRLRRICLSRMESALSAPRFSCASARTSKSLSLHSPDDRLADEMTLARVTLRQRIVLQVRLASSVLFCLAHVVAMAISMMRFATIVRVMDSLVGALPTRCR
jgi:hypothetical protein